MRFYRVEATPPFLVRSESDAKRSARAAGTSFREIDVPADKTGLFNYLNELLATLPAAPEARDFLPAERAIEDEPLTAAKLETMFTPRESARVEPRLFSSGADRLCDAISRLEGLELGNVALEVAARFKALASSA